MTKNITNRQLFFILLLTITALGIVNIAKTMAEHAGTGYWIPVLTMAIFFAFGAAIIVKLNNMHKDKTLCEYSKKLIGPFFTKVISFFYFIYFTLILVYLILQVSIILQANYLKSTPIWATMLVGIPVYCYVAYKGINTLARMVEIIGILYFVVGLAIIALMFSQGDILRILPLFVPSQIHNYITAIRYTILPFLGIEVLLFIPFSSRNGKKSIYTAFFSVIIIGLFYLVTIMSSIMKVGLNSIVHYKNAVIVTIRDIEVPILDFLKRLDVLYLTLGFLGLFMSVSIVYAIITEILLKLIPRINRLIIVLSLAVVLFFACFFVSTISADYIKFINKIGIILGLVAAILIPILLLIITLKRKKHN